jgi:serine/threonine protein kinase
VYSDITLRSYFNDQFNHKLLDLGALAQNIAKLKDCSSGQPFPLLLKLSSCHIVAMTTYDAPPQFEFVQELSCDCGEQYLAKCKRKNSKETVIVEQAIVDVAPRSHIHRMNNNFEISKFLQACVTENILQIHEKVVFTNTRKQSVVALIKEDFESISLDTFLALQPNQQVALETFVELASNMCRALQSVHQANVVHLNLQPSCFLINKSTLEVKLRNFGQSKIVSEKDPFIHGSLRVSSFTYISRMLS